MKVTATSIAALVIAAALAGPALAMGKTDSSDKQSSSGGYTEAEKAVQAKEYRRAIRMLEPVVAEQPRNVDALNYLGYSHRQLGEYDEALGYYRKALAIDADHRGANEYLGQLYLQTGDLKAARAQLAKLRRICPSGCEERDSLQAAIAKAERS